MTQTEWYQDWQNQAHAVHFDGRVRLSDRNLVRNYECLNDVRLLNERIERARTLSLVEVGCATGEFYRYLQRRYPQVAYYGVDISEAAIVRARAKYAAAVFLLSRPDEGLAEALMRCRIAGRPEVIYSKDVVHHQTEPLAFMDQLFEQASEAVIMRLRTRDVGATEWDPTQSCQYHYDGWMPYIVMNLDELIAHIQRAVPGCEVVAYRHRMVLGGQVNRFLPKACYLKETGTAETAVGVFRRTAQPGRVQIEDRDDERPTYTIDYRLRHAVGSALRGLR